jgi:DNA-binding response OmpR family regulator
MSGKRTILIIDDDKAIRTVLHEFFVFLGFEAYCAADGKAALHLLEKRDFDIVITDYSMPGINGVDLTKILRSRCPNSLIIGISADCEEDDFLNAGADGFLNKPFRPRELLSIIMQKHQV